MNIRYTFAHLIISTMLITFSVGTQANDHLKPGNGPIVVLPVTIPERFIMLETQIEAQQVVINELVEQNKELLDRVSCIAVQSGTNDFIFNGCNVHIRNGAGETHSLNGFGNLIIGYNDDVSAFPTIPKDRTGSHNLVVGNDHTYSSTGGFVAGQNNVISGSAASVSGGSHNEAKGTWSSVSGGSSNDATGHYSSVLGGNLNDAIGRVSSVSGGIANDASGIGSSVSGGEGNTAIGPASSVSGGANNNASGDLSSVSAGSINTASGRLSSVSGGYSNEASGLRSSVTGGELNEAIAEDSTVLGGFMEVETTNNDTNPNGF